MGEYSRMPRYCTCGARLARDNTEELCGPCQRKASDLLAGAPHVPPEFWEVDSIRDALADWHMGRVILAYRTHPYHGQPIAQDVVAGWMDISQTQLGRYETGGPITDLTKLVRWAQVLHIPPHLLWFDLPGQCRAAIADHEAREHRPIPHPPASRGKEVKEETCSPLDEEMAVAAEESVRFLQAAAYTNTGPHTLEQFHADIRRIVAVYSQQPAAPTFDEVRSLRNQAFALLRGRQQPGHTRDLYYVAGLLGGILANAAFDLGSVSTAETHARTAFLCAEFAGHNGLKAWVRGTQSMLAYWNDRPGDAVALARSGWEIIPERGTARVRLAALEARALARMKDAQGTRAALAKADRAREQVVAADEPGGMLAFPVAKQLYYTSSCALWLGGRDGYRAAERDATHAITLFEALPDGHRRLGEQCLAHVDLALARLGQGDLDGAAAGVRTVLDMATLRRVESAMRRLRHVADILGGPAYQAHRPARELRGQIIEFPGASAGSLPAVPAAGTTDIGTAERLD